MNKAIGIVVGVGATFAVVFTGFLWTCCRVYVPAGQMAIVTAKTGRPLPPGRILAEPGEKGGLRDGEENDEEQFQEQKQRHDPCIPYRVLR